MCGHCPESWATYQRPGMGMESERVIRWTLGDDKRKEAKQKTRATWIYWAGIAKVRIQACLDRERSRPITNGVLDPRRNDGQAGEQFGAGNRATLEKKQRTDKTKAQAGQHALSRSISTRPQKECRHGRDRLTRQRTC